jgi:hypothetical protein
MLKLFQLEISKKKIYIYSSYYYEGKGENVMNTLKHLWVMKRPYVENIRRKYFESEDSQYLCTCLEFQSNEMEENMAMKKSA